MRANPRVVNELRMLFMAGATPTALIRRIAERLAGEPNLDAWVRDYFREAFGVPMLRVGPEQVRHIAGGGQLPVLNVTVLPVMVQNRAAWDAAGDPGRCWLDEATAEQSVSGPSAIPELAGCWDRLDDEAKQFIARTICSAAALHTGAHALAALAEQLQSQLSNATVRRAIGA